MSRRGQRLLGCKQLVSYEPGELAEVFAAELIICLGYEEKGIVKRNHSTEGNLKILIKPS